MKKRLTLYTPSTSLVTSSASMVAALIRRALLSMDVKWTQVAKSPGLLIDNDESSARKWKTETRKSLAAQEIHFQLQRPKAADRISIQIETKLRTALDFHFLKWHTRGDWGTEKRLKTEDCRLETETRKWQYVEPGRKTRI